MSAADVWWENTARSCVEGLNRTVSLFAPVVVTLDLVLLWSFFLGFCFIIFSAQSPRDSLHSVFSVTSKLVLFTGGSL